MPPSSRPAARATSKGSHLVPQCARHNGSHHWSTYSASSIAVGAAEAIRLALANPDSDGLLVVLTPQAMTDPTSTAERLVAMAATTTKPLLASWMGGQDVEAGVRLLNAAGIATYRYPDAAVQLFDVLWRYSDNLRALY